MEIEFWLVMTLGIFLSACAASSHQPPPAAVTEPVAASQKPGPPNYETAELDRRAREMGYRVETRNGERFYCQNSAPVGTHISRMHCLSIVMMAQMAREDDEIQDKLSQRGNKLCPSCIQKNN